MQNTGAGARPIVVIDLGSSMFFLSPQKTGQRLFSRAIQVEPDLVVAIDFLLSGEE